MFNDTTRGFKRNKKGFKRKKKGFKRRKRTILFYCLSAREGKQQNEATPQELSRSLQEHRHSPSRLLPLLCGRGTLVDGLSCTEARNIGLSYY